MALTWLHKHGPDGDDISCCPECEAPADDRLTYCTVCGYDLVTQARTNAATMGRPLA